LTKAIEGDAAFHGVGEHNPGNPCLHEVGEDGGEVQRFELPRCIVGEPYRADGPPQTNPQEPRRRG
jgi:hypothetical protein